MTQRVVGAEQTQSDPQMTQMAQIRAIRSIPGLYAWNHRFGFYLRHLRTALAFD
jgi:hypothetical protein